jgi:hypothetical protein
VAAQKRSRSSARVGALSRGFHRDPQSLAVAERRTRTCCGKAGPWLPAIGHAVRMKNYVRKLAADQRGDVPGWVLITLMTAGLVIIIWGLAGPALSGVFQQAIERVTGF